MTKDDITRIRLLIKELEEERKLVNIEHEKKLQALKLKLLEIQQECLHPETTPYYDFGGDYGGIHECDICRAIVFRGKDQ